MTSLTSDIVKDHIANGKLYPRPIFKCDGCKGDIIICWGEKRDPYFRHKKGVNKCKVELGKQVMHTKATDVLLEYLNQGRKAIYNRRCRLCSSGFTIETNAVRYDKEVSYRNCRFDIAGYIGDTIVFGIEVFNKHRTVNILPRNDIEWVEVRAEDVLDILKEGDLQQITLTDIREYLCSSCKSNTSNEDRMDESVSIHCNQSSDFMNPIDNKVSITQPLDQYKEKLMRTYYKEYALSLGYLGNPYRHVSEKIKDIAIRGKYRIPINWHVSGFDFEDLTREDKIIWSDIIEKGRCLKCLCKHEISWFKPFCRRCYNSIRKKESDDGYDEKWVEVSREVRDEYRRKLRWFDDIPEMDMNKPCVICKSTDVRWGNNWWFGKKKRICYHCIIKVMESSGITCEY